MDLVQRLRQIRAAVAHEIDPASRSGNQTLMETAVKARDALNDMLVAAGDEETAQILEKHYSLDEMSAMSAVSDYSGVGCPNCGPDADVEGDHVEIIESGAQQEVACGKCDKVWINRYRFDGVDGAYRQGDAENYGHELILDLHQCDIGTFTRKSIGEYFDELCEVIGMQAEDRHFWDDEGLLPEHCQTNPKTCGVSAVQFILTSTIVVHTLTKLNAVYVNIFSCKDFDEDAANRFTIQWFRARQHHSTSVARR